MFLAFTNYEFEHCILLDCILAFTPGPQLEQRTFGVLFEVDISTLTYFILCLFFSLRVLSGFISDVASLLTFDSDAMTAFQRNIIFEHRI